MGRSLTGEPAWCTGEWGTCWCGSLGQNPWTSPLSSNSAPHGHKAPLCCGQLCSREKGLCAAYSFVSIPCYYCSAFAAPSTQQLSRTSTCFSFFPRKEGSFNASCAISQGCIPATTLRAAKGWGTPTPGSAAHMDSTQQGGCCGWIMSKQNLELCWAKEGASLYKCSCIPQGEHMHCIGFANSVPYECIVPFLLTPLLLNQGNGTGRKSRSHPHPEAGLATPALADRNVICLKTTNEPSLLFFFANLIPVPSVFPHRSSF